MERAAGAEPAILGILRHAGQQRVARALLQRLGNGRRQNARHLQTDALITAQVHTAAVQERAVLLHLNTGDRRVADIDSVVAAEQIARLRFQLFIIEVIFAQDLTGGVLTFEVDDQPGQRLRTHVFEGQAYRNFPGHVPFQQFHPDELDRASGRVIVGAGLRHQGKILIHDPTPTFYSWASGRSVSGPAAVSVLGSSSCTAGWTGAGVSSGFAVLPLLRS